METLTQYKEIAVKLLAEIEAYEAKQTKACSLRIRKYSNQLGKDGTHLRKAMLEADKADK